MEKGLSFQQMIIENLDMHVQKVNLISISHHIQKLIQNGSEYLIKSKTIQLLEKTD